MFWLNPDYVVLDIETVAGDPSDAEAWMRRAWSPSGNWKPETIGNRWLEALDKKRDRLALMDGSPIVCVQLKTPAGCEVLHWMACDEAAIAGAELVRVSNERAMLAEVRDRLNACSESELVGHNVRRFDLPRLRFAMLKAGLRLPECLAASDHSLYDTMDRWGRFSVDDRPFVSLSECLTAVGLPNHKDQVSGEDVGRLWSSGDFKTLLTYSIADVLAEEALYLRMTGRAGE